MHLLPVAFSALRTAPTLRGSRVAMVQLEPADTLEPPEIPGPLDANPPPSTSKMQEAVSRVIGVSRPPTIQESFARGSDVLALGDKVTAKCVVNVLGRWRKCASWNSIGPLVEMDQLFNGVGEVTDGPALRRAWQRWDEEHATSLWAATVKADRATTLPPWKARGTRKPIDPMWGSPEDAGRVADEAVGLDDRAATQPWVSRSPERRGWAIRRGQAQRYWHNANVRLLPFRDDAMARSVGATAAELDATPINPLACDVVFDAICRSQSGIVDQDLVDVRRAAYTRSDGGFDADAFAADLSEARGTVVKAWALPASANAIFLFAFINAGGLAYAAEAGERVLSVCKANVALWTGGGL